MPRAYYPLPGVTPERMCVAQMHRYNCWVSGKSLCTYAVWCDAVTGYFGCHREAEEPLNDSLWAKYASASQDVELEMWAYICG